MPPLKELTLREFADLVGHLAEQGEWDRVAIAALMMSIMIKSGAGRLHRPPLVRVTADEDGPVYSLNELA